MKLKKKLLKITSLFLTVAMIGTFTNNFNKSEQVFAAEKVNVSINPFNKSPFNDGVFQGWGSSLCWWANRIGYSDTLAEKAAIAFYNKDKGLGLNISRYNIGGGDDPTHDHITRTDSNMPGFMYFDQATQSYKYNWNADQNQINVLQHILKQIDEEPIVEAFSNSPPYFMTNSGCTSGAIDASKNNLKDNMYPDFAEYLANVSLHFKNNLGITFQSISPMNEPYTNYWGAYSKKQEGCHFDQGTPESNILVYLGKALEAKGLQDIIISGTDETSIDTQISSYKALGPTAKSYVKRIDTHTYSGSKRSELKQLAQDNNVNLWMSEVDGGGTAGTNAGEMGAGLWLSQRILDDMNGMMPTAWILWQLIDNHISTDGYDGKKDTGMPNTAGGYWGVAVANHDTEEIILTKKYYAFGQFTKYIRPGYILLNSSANTLVAYDKANNKLVIVATNTTGSDLNYNFDLSAFGSAGTSVDVIRTSGDLQNGENWAKLPSITPSATNFETTLKPNSVTTYIVNNIGDKIVALDEVKLSSTMISGSAPWNNTSNDVSKLIDGSTTTFFDGVGDGWAQIDLGKNYNLQALGFAPRSGYEYRCVDAYISVSKDGQNWSKVYTINYKPYDGINYIYKNNFSVPIEEVRYIKYNVPSGKPTNQYNSENVYCCNLSELKVYGNEAVSTTTTVTSQTTTTTTTSTTTSTSIDQIIYGDFNKDTKVDNSDLVSLSQHLIGENILTGDRLLAADLTSDGSVDVADLALLKQYIMGDKVKLGQ